MHDFCICANNAVKGKVLAALLKYLSKRGMPRSDVHKGSFEQKPLAWAAPAALGMGDCTGCLEKPYAAAVCSLDGL